MKAFLVILLFLVSFCSSANDLSLVPGVYHLEWAYGPNDNYKIVPGVVGNVHKIDGFFYLKKEEFFPSNDTREEVFQSNDTVYIVIGNDSSLAFYMHDELDSGPTIGWANVHVNKRTLIIDNPTTKYFYNDAVGDNFQAIKYRVGVKFAGDEIKNVTENVPVEILKKDAFKVDCNEYFKLNERYGNRKENERNNPMDDYSRRVLLNYDGLCNYIVNKHNKIELLNGWMLFKRIG